MGFSFCTVCQSSSVVFSCKSGGSEAVLCENCVLGYMKSKPGTHVLSDVNAETLAYEPEPLCVPEALSSRERELLKLKESSDTLYKLVNEFSSQAIVQDRKTYENLQSLSADNQKKEVELRDSKLAFQDLKAQNAILNQHLDLKTSELSLVQNQLRDVQDALMSSQRFAGDMQGKIIQYEEEIQKLQNSNTHITNALVSIQMSKDQEIQNLKKSHSEFESKEQDLLQQTHQKNSEITQLLASCEERDSKLQDKQSLLHLLQEKITKYEENTQQLTRSQSQLQETLSHVQASKDQEIRLLAQRVKLAEESKAQPTILLGPSKIMTAGAEEVEKKGKAEVQPKSYLKSINMEGWNKESKKRYKEFKKGPSLWVTLGILTLNKKCPTCKMSHELNPTRLKFLACKCKTVIYCINCGKKAKCICGYSAALKDLPIERLPFKVNE